MEEHLLVTIGSILGDGNLKYFSERTQNSQIYVAQHSSKLSYLEWLHSKYKSGFEMYPIKSKKGYQQHYFISKPNKIMGSFRKVFYPKGKKIVPLEIEDLLKNPISLAVWYMDDGTLDKRSKYHFNSSIATYNFSFEECTKLSEVLNKNFGILVSVNQSKMREKIYPRLYVKSESMDRFISLVKPFVQPVFNYKIGI